MNMKHSCQLGALALAGAILLSPAIASAQDQAMTQPAPPAAASMQGMAGMPMQDDKMPTAMPQTAKKAGSGGMKMGSMAKRKARHRHAKPAAAMPAPMPADKPMPMQDDM